MSASPLCTVNGSSAVNVVTVGNNSLVTIQLSDLTGVTTWSITAITADDATLLSLGNNLASVPLTINNTTKTATFTSPNQASAIIFKSTVNGGMNSAGQLDASLSTTFKVSVPLAHSIHLACVGEEREQHSIYGWTPMWTSLSTSVSALKSGSFGSYPIVSDGYFKLGSSNGWQETRNGRLFTSNNTPSAVLSWNIPANSTVLVCAKVEGIRDTAGAAYGAELRATFRVGTGNVFQVGTTTTLFSHADAGASGVTSTIDFSVGTIRVMCTGRTGETWRFGSTTTYDVRKSDS